MSGIVLTAYNGSILGPIAKFLGWIMNWVYVGLSAIGIHSVVLSIVVITVIIYMCLLPLTIKQQKFSKLSQKMQPEIKAIQDKYKGKKDQASMQAMQEETQLVYQKYGVSPSGSCIQLIIQMPILFALYRVFYNIPAYITSLKEPFNGLIDGVLKSDNYVGTLASLLEKHNLTTASGLNANNIADKLADVSGEPLRDFLVDIFYKLPSTGWDNLSAFLAENGITGIDGAIQSAVDGLHKFNYFLGLNISDTPFNIIKDNFSSNLWLAFLALLIPVLSYLTQLANIKMMPQADNGNDQMAQQMKTMNLMMPLISLFFCFTVPVGLGIYWICSALVRVIQQFFINRHIANLDLDDIIKQNQEKAKKKREKMGISEHQIREAASIKTKSIDAKANVNVSSDNEEKLADANLKKANAKQGSLASKANLVKDFNERNSRN